MLISNKFARKIQNSATKEKAGRKLRTHRFTVYIDTFCYRNRFLNYTNGFEIRIAFLRSYTHIEISTA
jgi:hypothetical protein